MQEEDCSPYSVVPDEGAVDHKAASQLQERVASAQTACSDVSGDDAPAAAAVAVRLQFLQHVLEVCRPTSTAFSSKRVYVYGVRPSACRHTHTHWESVVAFMLGL